MIKIKAIYETQDEKDKLIQELKQKFYICKISKEYDKEDSRKRVYIDLR